jgi:hypothetical protein
MARRSGDARPAGVPELVLAVVALGGWFGDEVDELFDAAE